MDILDKWFVGLFIFWIILMLWVGWVLEAKRIKNDLKRTKKGIIRNAKRVIKVCEPNNKL